jgi:predicted acetyltransferase
MNDNLDCHPASYEELTQAHANVHSIWSKGLPLDEHISSRLNAPHHRRANWYVGTINEEVVVSLGAYPMDFTLNDKTIPGFAIGSVFTKENSRKKGFAAELLNFVEKYELDKYERKISILYSDINPDYYKILGYQICISPQSQTNLSQTRFPDNQQFLSLVEFDKNHSKGQMKEIYKAFHHQNSISILRSDDYWEMILEKFPDDTYYWLINSGNQTVGYVRLKKTETELRITDYGLIHHETSLLADMYCSILNKAIEWNCQQFTGWLPDLEITNNLFELSPRQTEITMIKSLDSTIDFDDTALNAINYFCEIDHV